MANRWGNNRNSKILYFVGLWNHCNWHTSFPIWNQSIVACQVLTVASCLPYRFLRRQGRWSGIPITWRIFQSLLWHSQRLWLVNKAKVDVFLELSCFFDDPADVGNLVSGSSAFSKPSGTSGSSQFTYYWNLTCRILSITLLRYEMSAIVQ